MPRVQITIDSVKCIDQQESGEDEVYLRWAFWVGTSTPRFHPRPQRGTWTMRTGREQLVADRVVNQTIDANRDYFFELQLWEEDFGRAGIVDRLLRGGSYFIRRLWFIPFSWIAGAIAGIADADDLLGRKRTLIRVDANEEEDGGAGGGGLGVRVETMDARPSGGTSYEVKYTVNVSS